MMKLDKSKWSQTPFSDVVECVEKHDKTPLQNGLINFVGLENIDSETLKIIGSGTIENGTTFSKTFKGGDVLFGKRRAYLRKVAIADFDGICSGDILVFRAIENRLSPNLLLYYVSSDTFISYAVSTSAGSLSPRTKWRDLAMYEIPLPPQDEQQRIVELFQSVEQSIVQAERQEKNLKLLQKSLSNGLASNPPVFGNLLSKENCKPCSFSDIVECIEVHDKTPLENGLIRFVGLEHIESENFALQGYGNVEDGTTFTKRFAKGDALFGKRRAYLKKVAVADFDGICSSDILVFRAIEKEIIPELLPYYVSSDAFMNHAVSTSAGSLSPRTKWRDLAGFQLSVPDIKTQEKIVDVLEQLSQSLQWMGQQKATLKKLKQKLLNEILG